jgi:hypothetical protein
VRVNIKLAVQRPRTPDPVFSGRGGAHLWDNLPFCDFTFPA